MNETRSKLVERAIREGILQAVPEAELLQAPVPLEMVLEIALKVLDKINPPGRCYD